MDLKFLHAPFENLAQRLFPPLEASGRRITLQTTHSIPRKASFLRSSLVCHSLSFPDFCASVKDQTRETKVSQKRQEASFGCNFDWACAIGRSHSTDSQDEIVSKCVQAQPLDLLAKLPPPPALKAVWRLSKLISACEAHTCFGGREGGVPLPRGEFPPVLSSQPSKTPKVDTRATRALFHPGINFEKKFQVFS